VRRVSITINLLDFSGPVASLRAAGCDYTLLSDQPRPLPERIVAQLTTRRRAGHIEEDVDSSDDRIVAPQALDARRILI